MKITGGNAATRIHHMCLLLTTRHATGNNCVNTLFEQQHCNLH